MAPYISQFGDNVYVEEILDAAGIWLTDLPVPIGTHFASQDGLKAFLCWNAVLGKCRIGKGCKYKRNHPGKNDLSDKYAESVVAALCQAVDFVVASKQSPAKKLKQEGAPSTK